VGFCTPFTGFIDTPRGNNPVNGCVAFRLSPIMLGKRRYRKLPKHSPESRSPATLTICRFLVSADFRKHIAR
jgi:hypothetical protein